MIEILKYVHNKFFYIPKAIIIDNEFYILRLRKFLQKNWIQHEVNNANQSFENRKREGIIRTMGGMSRYILNKSRFSVRFWPFAVLKTNE